MEKNNEQCACIHYMREQAKYMRTKSTLSKVKCAECGKEFLTNKNGKKVHCFDCEG